MKLSKLADNLTAFSINKISEAVNKQIEQGDRVFNLTVGDFLPQQFNIPVELENEIVIAYREKNTNYPNVGGMHELRTAIAGYVKLRGDLDYNADEILIASGARPLIYLLLKTLVDPGEKVINIVPSWNNQHYIYLADAVAITLKAKPENNFLITAEEIKPHLKEATLITLCSPLNPSGTAFGEKALKDIIDLIVAENKQRIAEGKKPLYVFFDMIYWLLTYNETKFCNPLMLNLEIRDYMICIDGISKSFAATGVRVGWAMGPKLIIDKMRSILEYIGAWAPKSEQIGVAKYLSQHDRVDAFLGEFKQSLLARLNIFYKEMQELKTLGYKVDATMPQGAIYLTIKLDLVGTKTRSGKMLNTVEDISVYLLECAKVALVPFYVFGSDVDCPWFRISVGRCSIDDAKAAASSIRRSVEELT